MPQWPRLRASRNSGPAWAGVSAVRASTVSQEILWPAAQPAMCGSSPAARQAAVALPRMSCRYRSMSIIWAVPGNRRVMPSGTWLGVFQVEDPADPQLVHRLHVPGLRMQCVGRHDDQLFSFSCSFSCFVAVAVAVVVVVVVVVWAAVVAGAGVAEDGVQEGDEAGDLVGFRFDVGLAQDGAGGDIVGGEQVGLGAVGPDGAADGLAVDGDVPPVQPPGGCLLPQPGAHLRVGGLGVDRA